MTMSIFRNCFTLKFKSPSIEKEYILNMDKQIKKYTVAFTSIILALSILNTTIQIVYFPTFKISNIYFQNFITTILVLAANIINLFLSIYCKHRVVLKILNYINYMCFSLDFITIRCLCLNFLKYDYFFVIYSLFFLDYMFKIIWVMSRMMDLMESIYCNIIQLIYKTIFYAAHERFVQVYGFYLTAITIFFAGCIVSYCFVYQIRKAFFYSTNLDKKNKWYKSIFDNTSNGIIYIKNDKINYVNKILITKLLNNSVIHANLNVMRVNILETENIIPILISNNVEANLKLIMENSEIIINELFCDLLIPYEQDNISDCQRSRIKLEQIQFFQDKSKADITKKILECFKDYYKNNCFTDEFTLLGMKDLEVRNEGGISFLSLEVHCRFYIDDDRTECFEFVLNDITYAKINEEKNAEYKYKCLFLNKIAHELKNPLICISELSDQMQDMLSCQDQSKVNMNIDPASKILQSITAMSQYLLIMLKDFDHFSKSISNKNVIVDKTNVNTDGLMVFCNTIAQSLLVKQGKENTIQFRAVKGIDVPDIIYTDEMKLKQILINLISNATKFTSKGRIVLEIKHEEGKIKFSVEDTGIGIKEPHNNLLKELVKDLKNGKKLSLGLSVINDLTSRLGSKVKYTSEEGIGTTFWFYLDIPIVDKKQINTNKDKVSLNITINNYINNTVNNPEIRNHLPRQLRVYENRHGSLNESDKTVELEELVLSYPKITTNLDQTLINNNIMIDNTNMIIDRFDSDKNCSYFSSGSYNIIVVDDEALTRQSNVRIIKKVAQEKGIDINIIEAVDGIECIYLAYKCLNKGLKISCIVSDEMMNYMRGSHSAEVLGRITRNININIPFYLVTAYEDDKTLQSINNIYISEIYTKPLRKDIAERILSQLS